MRKDGETLMKKNDPYVFCPLTKICCTKECALFCDGKCALLVLTERMVDVASAINSVQWAIKERPDNY